MKKLTTLIGLLSALSFSIYAGDTGPGNSGNSGTPNHIRYIEKAICDDVELEIVNEERVYINLERSIIGIGAKVDDCAYVDFYQVLMTSFGTSSEGPITKSAEFISVLEAGRRNSCEEGVLEFDGPQFEAGYYSENNEGKATLTFKNIYECETLVYSLKD